MSDFKAEVVKLTGIEKHPNADALSIVKVFGFPCIFKTGDFNEGDLAVYIPAEPIALVPVNVPEFSFLTGDENGYAKIKAIRLRGTFSLGLLIPARAGWTVGQDVTEILGVIRKPEKEDFNLGGENESPPGWLPTYTDIQSLRKYYKEFIPGAEVVLTEKIHGCVKHGTKIRMVDGSTKTINNLNIGDEILGINSDGQIVPNKVIRKFNNGKADKWLKIKGTRRAAGKGNSYFSIYCTPEHRFFNPKTKTYVEAQNLKTDDSVVVTRTDYYLSPIQEQILLGKMLGDGFFSYIKGQPSAKIVWCHKAEHAEYVNWVARGIGYLAHPTISNLTSGYGTLMLRRSTVSSCFILEKFKSFYINNKKIVPEWVIEKLTPISIAFWYMDDGSLSHHKDQEDRVLFAVCAFTEEDCQILIKSLKKFDINAVYYKDPQGYSRLRINATDAEKLFLLISPYIPECMQYKLPERYRGHNGWLPDCENEYKSALIEQKILSIEEVSLKSNRYDIETETGNYFAPDVLVHNCNSRFVYFEDRLWVGSRNNVKRYDPKNMWWGIAIKLDLENKLKNYPGLIIYGEAYGQVQNLKYDRKDTSLIVFDIFNILDSTYLDYDEAKKITKELGLDFVPEVYRGPFTSLEELEPYADGKSLIANNIREGFVIRPVKEEYNNAVGRLILKLHGQEFLIQKGNKK